MTIGIIIRKILVPVSWERVFVLKTRCDWSNCYVTYFYFLVRPYQFVVFHLFLLEKYCVAFRNAIKKIWFQSIGNFFFFFHNIFSGCMTIFYIIFIQLFSKKICFGLFSEKTLG